VGSEAEACAPIAGAVGPQYTLTEDDVDAHVRAVRTVRNAAGTDVERAAFTGPVAGFDPDTDGPAAPTITTPIYGPTSDRSAYIDWTGAELGGHFECLVDGQPVQVDGEGGEPWGRCSGPLQLTGLADGEHKVRIRQVDEAGNAGQVAELVWTVDTAAPAKPHVASAPPAVTSARTATIAFTGDEDARFQCLVDGGGESPLPAEVSHWTKCKSPLVLEELADGEHTVLIRQLDDAGNAGAEVRVAWIVDTAAPGVPVVKSRPADGPSTAAGFELGGEPGATFQYRLDGGDWVKVGASFNLAGLAVGQHTVVLRQVDAAGNAGDELAVTWTVVAPAQEPVATPAPAPAPKFTATIGDAKGGKSQSGANTVTVQDRGVDVGCKMTGVELSTCKVDLYADVDAHGKVVASGRVLVGTGIVEADGRTNKLAVRVVLNAKGRELLRRNPQGLDVQVAITGTPVSGAPIKTTGNARLVAKRSRVVVGGFDVDSPRLGAAATRRLAELADKLAGGATVKVIGHTDGSADSKRYLRKLGLERARAVKAFLASHGAKATDTLVPKADTQPRAPNASKAGRALNRRVVLEIVR
jgi:outer membrane protein OmpA-like peptidoglycan-associated protein